MNRALTVVLAIVVLSACGLNPPTGGPAAQPPAAARAQWEDDWDRVVAAAKKEGVVTVFGPAGDVQREVLTRPFEEKYGISVEFVGGPGRQITPRVAAERGAGQYLWDILVTGTTTALTDMIPLKALDPIEPILILPEVKDPKSWRNGALEFVDDTRQILVMCVRQREIVFFNTGLAKADEFKSYKDLLDPKWRGKIVLDDPRSAGPGQASFTFFYLHPDLGPDFIRALGRQEITLLRDFRQEADAVGQGRFPILIGTDIGIIEPIMNAGVPIGLVDPRQVREGSDTSAGVSALSLFNRAPHPNAATVYINWLLSREGQTAFAQAVGYISNRVDVPTDHTFAYRIPAPGAVKTYDVRAMGVKDDLVALLEEVFGRQ